MSPRSVVRPPITMTRTLPSARTPTIPPKSAATGLGPRAPKDGFGVVRDARARHPGSLPRFPGPAVVAWPSHSLGLAKRSWVLTSGATRMDQAFASQRASQDAEVQIAAPVAEGADQA